jgi:hypothetical protein
VAANCSNAPVFVRASAALGIVDHLRCRFARLKSATGRTRCGELGAHFPDLRSLLLELGAQELNFSPLLCANRLEIVRQSRDRRLLFLNLFVLLEELVQQHRVHLVVANGVDSPFLSRTTKSEFTSATSSATNPNCGLFAVSLL